VITDSVDPNAPANPKPAIKDIFGFLALEVDPAQDSQPAQGQRQ